MVPPCQLLWYPSCPVGVVGCVWSSVSLSVPSAFSFRFAFGVDFHPLSVTFAGVERCRRCRLRPVAGGFCRRFCIGLLAAILRMLVKLYLHDRCALSWLGVHPFGFCGIVMAVLLPGVNLYFSSSSLSFPSLVLCWSLRACLWSAGVWVVCPPGYGLSCAGWLPVLRASVSVLASVAPFCLFVVSVCRSSCLVVLCVVCCSGLFFPSFSFSRPRAALPSTVHWVLGEPGIGSFNSCELD